jgi:hypothetical protein
VYRTVINNAQTVIESGGRASWKFIVFDHNRHQVEAARALSLELGFKNFYLHDHGRSQTPVFDRHGNFEHYIGSESPKEPTKIKWVLNGPQRIKSATPSNFPYEPAQSIDCDSLKKQEIYITANGEVYPCCFMGHYPLTFQTTMDTWYGHIGLQLREIVGQNNALEHGLEKALAWFAAIPERWQQPSWDQGRLAVCDTSCGNKNPYLNDQLFINDNTNTKSI